MKYDNPAARLLSIIERGKQIAPNEVCRNAWQQILSVSNNNPLLMSRLGKAMELPELTIAALQEMCPDEGNTWSHWESQVNHAFMSQNLNAGWDSFINAIDQHSVTNLRLAAGLLQAKSNTKILADSDMENVKSQLTALYEEIINSAFDEDVKKYIARYVRKIIIAIDEYKITGALPLLEAIETAIGHAALHPEYKNFLTDEDLGKRLLDTLAAMANVVTVAIGSLQLSQAIVPLLSR